MKDHKKIIIELMKEVSEIRGEQFDAAIKDESILLDSGLDSLGFAILVARLEEALGFDPFAEMENAFYPKTFAEFVAVYNNHKGA